MLKELEYQDDHVPLAVPIADAIEAEIVRRQSGDGDGLTAVYPCNDEENTYVVAEFSHGDEPIEVPKNTVVLGVFNGDLRVLIPREAYS